MGEAERRAGRRGQGQKHRQGVDAEPRQGMARGVAAGDDGASEALAAISAARMSPRASPMASRPPGWSSNRAPRSLDGPSAVWRMTLRPAARVRGARRDGVVDGCGMLGAAEPARIERDRVEAMGGRPW